jgi:hypothetical protein
MSFVKTQDGRTCLILRAAFRAACLLVLLTCPHLSGAATVQTGTGFVVSRQGHVLTNNHVIKGARSLRGQIEGREFGLTVVATDPDRDLAVLKMDGEAPPPLAFRKGKALRPGDPVVVVGFPLQGILSREANVTTGDMSANNGPGGDKNLFQLTAPVQPGNSGGPVLDATGLVVGVAVAKLSSKETFEATGDLPQNVNFAVKGSAAQDFLERNGILLTSRDPGAEQKPADIGDTARKSTVFIIGDSSGRATGRDLGRGSGRAGPGSEDAGAPRKSAPGRQTPYAPAPNLPPVLDNPAGQAKFNYTMEYLRDNLPMVWKDPDTGKEITALATATYETKNRPPCRDFRLEWDGGPFQGRACRYDKEDWRVE